MNKKLIKKIPDLGRTFVQVLKDQEQEVCCYGCATMRSACTNKNSINPMSENFNDDNLADLENAIGKRGLAV